MMIVVFRLGAHVPVPGVDANKLATLFASEDGLFGFFDLLSGGSFKNFSLFALGISPYITASIIVNLLQIAIPSLEQLAKEGEEGRKKLAQMTRYGTVILALIQAIGMSVGIFRPAFIDFNTMSVVISVLTLTAGTAFLMYLGEKITETALVMVYHYSSCWYYFKTANQHPDNSIQGNEWRHFNLCSDSVRSCCDCSYYGCYIHSARSEKDPCSIR